MIPTPVPIPNPLERVLTSDNPLVVFLIALIWALVILLVALLVSRLARTGIVHVMSRSKRISLNIAVLLGNVVSVVVLVLGIIFSLSALGVEWAALVTVLGTAGLALSLSLQDVLKNVIAGVYLLVEQPFSIGDRISVKDVTGKDAAAKMAILARLAFNASVRLDQVSCEGITRITPDDIEYAKELGLSLKLVGSAERIDGGVAVHVYPAFLYADHPLASVGGAFNAVTIESPAITEMTLSGPGAGGIQTASAVLGDVISAMIPPPSLPPPAVEQPIVTDVEFSFYLHLEVADRPGVLAQVAEILGLQGVSIRSVVQKGLGEEARLVMVMHPVLESKFRAAVDLISGLDFVREPPRVIRVIEETF